MYTQILKDILSTIEYDNGHIKDFSTFSSEVLKETRKNVDIIVRKVFFLRALHRNIQDLLSKFVQDRLRAAERKSE